MDGSRDSLEWKIPPNAALSNRCRRCSSFNLAPYSPSMGQSYPSGKKKEPRSRSSNYLSPARSFNDDNAACHSVNSSVWEEGGKIAQRDVCAHRPVTTTIYALLRDLISCHQIDLSRYCVFLVLPRIAVPTRRLRVTLRNVVKRC